MKKFLILLTAGLLLEFVSVVWAQATTPLLPVTHAETLSGTAITFPVAGQQTLLVVGFTRNSGDAATAWFKQAQPLCDAHPGVACYEVAVMQDAPSFMRGFILRHMRNGMPPERQAKFATVFENEPAWKQAFHYSNADDAYAVLLNATGEVVWHASGPQAAIHLDGLQAKLQP